MKKILNVALSEDQIKRIDKLAFMMCELNMISSAKRSKLITDYLLITGFNVIENKYNEKVRREAMLSDSQKKEHD